VTFGGKLAEYARTLGRGSHVMVQGAVRTREYDRDGVKQRVFELRADTVGKLDRAERRQDADIEPDPSEG
jgi:single-stranded DNA-binding protein